MRRVGIPKRSPLTRPAALFPANGPRLPDRKRKSSRSASLLVPGSKAKAARKTSGQAIPGTGTHFVGAPHFVRAFWNGPIQKECEEIVSGPEGRGV
jgi:hypothetical protein